MTFFNWIAATIELLRDTVNDLVKSNSDLNNKLESIYLNNLIGENLKFEKKKNLNFFLLNCSLKNNRGKFE